MDEAEKKNDFTILINLEDEYEEVIYEIAKNLC
jgi:hypothetical protein